MKARIFMIAALSALLAASLAACDRKDGGDRITLPPFPPSALAVLGADLGAHSAQVLSLVAGSARPGEHLQMIDAAARPAKVADPPVAPRAPWLAGPTPPKKLPAHPTQFQVDSHRSQEKAYHRQIVADESQLRIILAARMRAWAMRSAAELRAMTTQAPGTWRAGVGLNDAASYFSSLQQAGVGLGSRKVVVVFWPRAEGGAVVPLAPDSLTGLEVVVADFPGDEREQAEWQADLMQAGARRAIILVPGAAAELSGVVSRGLDGDGGPAPAVVTFALNSARLRGPARQVLSQFARELLTTYRNAPATVLGFTDPIGAHARNLRLSLLRALAVRAFLVRDGVAPSRLFAVGYGPDLPVAPAGQAGAQPLDRRVVVVIEPVS